MTPALGFYGYDSLLAGGSGDASLAGFFLHVLELLLGIVEGFLLVGNLLLVLRVLLVPASFIAHAVAGVGVHGGGANLVFALQHIEFARQQINLLFLGSQLVLQLFQGSLLGGLIFLSGLGRTLGFVIWSLVVGGLGLAAGGFDLARSLGLSSSCSRGRGVRRLGVRGIGGSGRRCRAYDGELILRRQIVVVENLRLRLGRGILADLPGIVSQRRTRGRTRVRRSLVLGVRRKAENAENQNESNRFACELFHEPTFFPC